jgi:hypothetical protein
MLFVIHVGIILENKKINSYDIEKSEESEENAENEENYEMTQKQIFSLFQLFPTIGHRPQHRSSMNVVLNKNFQF